MDWITDFGGASVPLLSLAAPIAIIALAHFVLFSLACRVIRSGAWRNSLSCLRWPSFWFALALTTGIVLRSVPAEPELLRAWRTVGGLLLPALAGWLAIGGLRAIRDGVERRADISVADNLSARRKRTRVGILTRIAIFVIILITVAMMLLSIPSIRAVGFTLMASAGLVAIVVGAAAQPAMKNLIAGVQMAFTEPIRIDDVVIIDGEWGRIEEISLTYVVVALWDQRRLIVPVSKLLENSFQNWTRRTSQLLGTIFLYLDPRANVARIRHKFCQILDQNARWDKRVGVVQVTDMKAEAIEVRLLVSAGNSANLFDLRCDVREAMIAFIQQEMPDALPHRRSLLTGEIEERREAA